MAGYVYALPEAPEETALVGGKAAALGRLLRAGFAAPGGFVLTTEAYRAFVERDGLSQRIAGLVAEAASGAEAEALRLFREAGWPTLLRSEIERAYESLGDANVCVRSSATGEDSGEASFAGLHQTLLNVAGVDAVRDAVLACWASLHSDAALAYRSGRALAHDAALRQAQDDAMAVVVQELVPADASGVAFTVDPVSGAGDIVVIDAAWGLGEGVVDGIVAPDHYRVSKAGGEIVRREIADKHVRVVPAPGGTTREKLPPDVATQPALTDAQAQELARLAARVEAHHGAPQDIEWALHGGRFYLLQARPVTAAGAPAGEGWVSEFDTPTAPDTVWTSANVQEVLPDHMSPFSISVFMESWQKVGTKPIERTGIRLKTQEPFSGFFYGRPFLNVTMNLEVMDQTPFTSAEPLLRQFYGEQSEYEVPEKRMTPGRLWRYINVLPRMIWFTLRMPHDIKRSERIVAEFQQDERERPFAERSDDELLAALDWGLDYGTEVSVTHVSGAGITSANFDMLGGLTRNWLDDESGSLQATLCSGLAELESAQPAYELWDLSRMVLASPKLRGAFEAHDGGEIERRLASIGSPEASAFRQRLDEFLSRHGHRSVMETEAAAKSWDEDLPTVFVMIRNYLHAPDSADPQQHEERQRQERERVTAEALARLSWWKRPLLRFVVRGAHQWVVNREHTKSLLVSTSHRARKLSRELARRLVDQGALVDIWDFYYLTLDEARALVGGELSHEVAYAHIERRRAEEERNRSVLLPQTFRGRPQPLQPTNLPLPDGHQLEGIAVSPGRVTGRARVILDPRQDGEIEPGEILVAPVTDAGWTPLFIAAAGVVVDVGSTLSHGSTVAREYGLPAVVNVKHGTRLIRSGQTITVDGTHGVVVLEQD